ncbi:hypothetical protein WR25_00462 [Diploscapter pachys]|uniref:Uncharacterized protein n=1 Tax=Diploscapter pachys TaxID=2018661 RepID=A0A2A2J1H5_9BILA|nr:hypothetical protein WR25_00462 [Diploscapter pachys]
MKELCLMLHKTIKNWQEGDKNRRDVRWEEPTDIVRKAMVFGAKKCKHIIESKEEREEERDDEAEALVRLSSCLLDFPTS